jgi:integrase
MRPWPSFHPRRLASPSFAAWLQVAAFTGLRPGELDALRRTNVDLERSRILVVEQFSAKTRTFTLPKNGLTREAPLTDPAREAIMALPVEGEFCFAPIRGEYWTASARAYHWKGRQGCGWMGRKPLSRYPPFLRLVHGQRPRRALGGRGDRAWPHRWRRAGPPPLRPPGSRAPLDRVTAAYGRTAALTQMPLV